jgi:hypothetical protein
MKNHWLREKQFKELCERLKTVAEVRLLEGEVILLLVHGKPIMLRNVKGKIELREHNTDH